MTGSTTPGTDVSSGREHLWLPLLRQLTRGVPAWTVLKNADSALYGRGDVDSVAPRAAWPTIGRLFDAWAADLGLGPTIVCRHIPRGAEHFTLLPGSTALLQLEVKTGATFRGSVLYHARDVVPLAVDDERGFRRLRPGAEGVIKLVYNGMYRGGRPNPRGLDDKQVVALLRSDPDGARAMAARFGPVRGAVLDGVAAVLAGGWDRPAMRRVEAWALAKALVQPHVIAERLWFRAVRKPSCPVLQAVYGNDRTAPPAVGAWLRRVARDHVVAGAAAP